MMGSDDEGDREEVRIGGRRAFRGSLLRVDVDRVRLPGGDEARREVVRHPGAAAVLPILPPSPGREGRPPEGRAGATRILLLRQFRYAVGEAVWEIPAGTLEEGESPEDCAGRELAEETGLRAGELRRLAAIRSSPGFTDETIHLFLARDLAEGEPAPEGEERFRPATFSLAEAMEMIHRGEIGDAKTVCALLLAASRQRFGAPGRL